MLQSTAQKTAAPGEAAFSNDNASRRPHARSGWRPSESATVLLAAPGLAVIAAEVAGNAALVRAASGGNAVHMHWRGCRAHRGPQRRSWPLARCRDREQRRMPRSTRVPTCHVCGYLPKPTQQRRARSHQDRHERSEVRAAILHVQPLSLLLLERVRARSHTQHVWSSKASYHSLAPPFPATPTTQQPYLAQSG